MYQIRDAISVNSLRYSNDTTESVGFSREGLSSMQLLGQAEQITFARPLHFAVGTGVAEGEKVNEQESVQSSGRT